jgi:hypothetical protein
MNLQDVAAVAEIRSHRDDFPRMRPLFSGSALGQHQLVDLHDPLDLVLTDREIADQSALPIDPCSNPTIPTRRPIRRHLKKFPQNIPIVGLVIPLRTRGRVRLLVGPGHL